MNGLRASFVGDRNAYSTYVVLIFPFLLFLGAETTAHATRLRVLVGLAMLLALVSAALTQNRNLWFAVFAEVVVWAVLLLFKAPRDVRRRVWKQYLAAGALGVVLFAGVLAYVIYQKAVVSHMTTESQFRFDQDPRFEIWAYAGQHIAERPLTGYGYGRGILRKDFRTHFDNPLKWHGHNLMIDYVMEAGVLGGFALLALFAAICRQAWAFYRDPHADVARRGAWVFAMLTGIVIKTMTDDILVRDSSLLFWSVLGLVFGWSLRAQRSARPR